MAREETNAGLIGAQRSSTQSSRSKKKSNASSQQSSGQRGPTKMIKVGMLVMIPCGLNVSIHSKRTS
jgi:hypothetical protein